MEQKLSQLVMIAPFMFMIVQSNKIKNYTATLNITNFYLQAILMYQKVFLIRFIFKLSELTFSTGVFRNVLENKSMSTEAFTGKL